MHAVASTCAYVARLPTFRVPVPLSDTVCHSNNCMSALTGAPFFLTPISSTSPVPPHWQSQQLFQPLSFSSSLVAFLDGWEHRYQFRTCGSACSVYLLYSVPLPLLKRDHCIHIWARPTRSLMAMLCLQAKLQRLVATVDIPNVFTIVHKHLIFETSTTMLPIAHVQRNI
jgi:hypothetical protein